MVKKKDSAMTEAARAMGSRGGMARAKSLSPEARQKIARKAAKKRWRDRDARESSGGNGGEC